MWNRRGGGLFFAKNIQFCLEITSASESPNIFSQLFLIKQHLSHMQVDVDKMLLFFSKCGNLFWHQHFFFKKNKENMSQRDNCITLLWLFKFICKNRCACFRNAHRGMFSIIFLEYHAPWHQISFTCCAQSAHERVKACREITQPRAIVLVFGPLRRGRPVYRHVWTSWKEAPALLSSAGTQVCKHEEQRCEGSPEWRKRGG